MGETTKQTAERRARRVADYCGTLYDKSTLERQRYCNGIATKIAADDKEAGMVLVPRAALLHARDLIRSPSTRCDEAFQVLDTLLTTSEEEK